MFRTNNSTRSNVANFALLVGALLSGVGVAMACAARSVRRERQRVEKYRDKALKDTFPASDPPASQYFDIPVNRL